jgi:small subunit ribosomal protein S20
MPNKHAALKQLRKDKKRVIRNQSVLSELKTLKKRAILLLDAKKTDEAVKVIPLLMKCFDQAAAKGIIHKNIASRTKSRLMHRLAQNAGKITLPALRASKPSAGSKAKQSSPQAPSSGESSQTSP